MSRRHQATRRRAYGRRQHEVHERRARYVDRVEVDVPGDAVDALEPLDSIDMAAGPPSRGALLDLLPAGFRWAESNGYSNG